MQFIKDFFSGIRSYSDAVKMIKRNELWQFFFFPGILNILLFSSILFLAWTYSGEITTWAISKVAEYQVSVSYPGVLRTFIRVIIYIFLFALYIKLYKYFVLILLSPLLAYIAERTQEISTGQSIPFRFSVFFNNIFRGLKITFRNLIIELPLTALLFILSFIPGVGIFTTVALLIIEAYFWGFSMIDYRNEYYSMTGKESIHFIKDHKGLAISNGLVFLFLLAIPIIGLLVAPALSVMAAGIASNKIAFSNGSTPQLRRI